MARRTQPCTHGTALRCAALGIVALLLGGCETATRPAFPHHYDLGAPPVVTSTPAQATGGGDGVLKVERIAVPPWLAGTGMHYRLHYRDDDTLASYANSDWAAPPATLLEPIIQRTLAADGAWRAVIGPGSPAVADATLRIRLDDFSQGFSTPGESASVLDATATLVDNHDDSVIAQRHFHVEIVAPTADAQGGALALRDASLQFATDLRDWLQRVDAGNHARHDR